MSVTRSSTSTLPPASTRAPITYCETKTILFPLEIKPLSLVLLFSAIWTDSSLPGWRAKALW
ncbi:hypothetical protein BAE44_0013029 [Dichanthelium oligosanthes]|uniref:Uncharacterized protein n=1 Tax=Dichanthelium oligosanthes TaxID=888268 RepID=A0A1E5VLK6_9POAL|nr:hypothetical protein BAE44_0013029 [Dichanthelium oligosanthes]